jgi:2-methylcitrate dehydratase PrpD
MKEMDPPTRAIVDYIAAVDYASLAPADVHAVTRNFVDTVACMAAGYDGQAAQAARAYARSTAGTPTASAVGVAGPVLLNGAVLANGTAILPGELPGGEQARPSHAQISAAVFAQAEAVGATPAQFIEAVFLASRLATALGDAAPLAGTGFAPSLYISISVAAGASKLLALDDSQRANAIAIAIVASLPISVPEPQPDSWWPIASAQAAMTAVFAARQASEGITGPPHVFDGTEALWETVTGPFELTGLGQAQPSAGAAAENPLSDAELGGKFEASVAARLTPQLLDELRTRLWDLPREPDLGPVAALLRQFSH